MSAIRKLAAEAADNGLLAPELAAGISRVKSAKTQGIRTGNWLSQRQAQALLSAPDITTLRGLRDRAILAVLLGCGLRRSEVAALTFTHLQQRDGRWWIQVQAQARAGEADQVCDADPRVHVPDRLPGEHSAGCHHKAVNQILPSAQIPLCRLDRGVAQQQLNLLKLSAARAA
jgi:integrase